MSRFPNILVVALFVHFGAPTGAEQVTWNILIDNSALDYEDPYVDLDYEQLEDLRTIVQETARLEQDAPDGADRDTIANKLDNARDRLAEDGIDPDLLISQRWVVAEHRKKAAMAANPAVDGETVTLGGYAIPAPPEDDGTRIVYLVPERGMCSHTPPPSPNQMIRARLSGKWSPTMMHEPVRLTGKLKVEDTQHSFNIIDGIVPMRSSFVMDVHEVETIQDLRTQSETTNEWATQLAEELRTSGQLPSR